MTTRLTSDQVSHLGIPLETALGNFVQAAAEFSSTWDPPSITAGSTATQAFTVTGALLGDFVHTSFTQALGDCILSGQVTAADQVTVAIYNHSAGTVNLTSGTLRIRLTRSA